MAPPWIKCSALQRAIESWRSIRQALIQVRAAPSRRSRPTPSSPARAAALRVHSRKRRKSRFIATSSISLLRTTPSRRHLVRHTLSSTPSFSPGKAATGRARRTVRCSGSLSIIGREWRRRATLIAPMIRIGRRSPPMAMNIWRSAPRPVQKWVPQRRTALSGTRCPCSGRTSSGERKRALAPRDAFCRVLSAGVTRFHNGDCFAISSLQQQIGIEESPGMTISRRDLVYGAITSAAAATSVSRVRAQSGEPVRVGLLTVKTGPLASGGIDMERALTMYLKERSYTLGGRKIDLIVADTAGVPATARTKTQELVEKNNVNCLIGPLAAFEALAIDDYIKQAQIPTLSVAAAEDMTQRRPNPWFVRATSTSAQCAHPLGEYCAKELKYARMIAIADDIAYGHEMCAGFQRTFEENGGKIVQKLFPPLTAPDYGTYVAQLKGADAIFLGFDGSYVYRYISIFVDIV